MSSTAVAQSASASTAAGESLEVLDDPIVNLTYILLPMLFIVCLGLGTTLSAANFKAVWADDNRRAAFWIGNVMHWVIMPPLSYALCFIFDLSKERSIGLVIVGCMAIGSSSSLFCYWAKNDLALSVVIGLTSTIAGFGLVPGMMYAFVTQTGLADGNLKVDYLSTIVALLILAIPVVLGIVIRQWNTVRRVTCCGKELWVWQCFEKGGSIIGGVFLVIAVTIGIIDNIELVKEDYRSWIAPALLQPIGHITMYACGKLAGLPAKAYRTISLQNGILNSTLAIAICTLSFPDAHTQRLVLTCPLFYSLWYVVHTAWITPIYWYVATRDPKHEYEAVVPDNPDSPQAATSAGGNAANASVGGGAVGAAAGESTPVIAMSTPAPEVVDDSGFTRAAISNPHTPAMSNSVTIHVPAGPPNS